MKLSTLTLLAAAIAIFSTSTFAQAPQAFSYQSIVYNNSGNYVSDQTIALQISIIKETESGDIAYKEVHHPTTNDNGLVSILIGTGTTSDDFTTIDWGTGNYFLKSEIDINNGENYTITGTQQLLSVPYALYAENAVPKAYIDSLVDSLQMLIENLASFNSPKANFTSTSQIVSPGSSISFTSTSSNNSSSYFWSFEGGSPTTSNLLSPIVYYNTKGSHSVSLKVSSPYGEDSIKKEDYINVPLSPIANFSSSDTIIHTGDTVTFTSTSTNTPTSYYWEFGSASTTTSILPNPSIVFGQQGSYTVSLTVSNLSGHNKETKKDFIQCKVPEQEVE